MMKLIQIADDFWNIRGSFKIGGVVDIGTQASLVRRANGRFLFLDSLTLDDETTEQVHALTSGGEAVEAVLNLHPFHTVHVKAMHEAFPHARHFGTCRHLEKFPDLPWESLRCEDSALHDEFADELEFSVPRGVDFVSSNPNLHFSSVLALHRTSGTIHVDDTLMYSRLPGPMKLVGKPDTLLFHLTLSRTLEKRAGAADEFRNWAEELIADWSDAKNLCAAHTAALLDERNGGKPISERIQAALGRVEKTLSRHARKYG